MPITLFDKANIPSPEDKRPFFVGENDNNYRKIVHDKMDAAYDSQYAKKNTANDLLKKDDEILKLMHRNITSNYADYAAHVSGYYYIQMIHGSWTDTVKTLYTSDNSNPAAGSYENEGDNNYKSNNDTSTFTKEHFNKIAKQFGQLATDIDIPQLNIEYESVSGKSRHLSYASKLHFAGDFSINFIENYTNHVIRYHESWFKYIDALKKGYVNLPINSADNDKSYFIDIPYFNAVWVVIFAPFTTNIRGLIKIMGVAPINLPIKQIIGDRSKSALTTINQNYKSNDMIYKFFDTDADRLDSPFYKEFIQDMKKIHNL